MVSKMTIQKMIPKVNMQHAVTKGN